MASTGRRQSRVFTASLAIAAACAPDAVLAQDKSQYNLFRPTPDALMREMTTDRPDTTEVPFTIDAGHFQIETNAFAFNRSFRQAGEVTKGYEFFTTNLRIGLTHNTELTLVTRPYGVVRTSGPGGVSKQSGIGSVDIRAKFNLWGNDSFGAPGSTAFALLPYVTLPTDRFNGISTDDVEGGVNAIYAIQLNETYGLGINAIVSADRNPDRPGHHAAFLLSASLGRDLTDKLGIYYEVVGRFGFDDGQAEALILGAGITYALTKNVQLDAGINFGVTNTTDRVNPFVGFSARF